MKPWLRTPCLHFDLAHGLVRAGGARAGTDQGVIAFAADAAASAGQGCRTTGQTAGSESQHGIACLAIGCAASEGKELAQCILRTGLRGKKRAGRQHGSADRLLTVLHDRHHCRADQRHDHQNENGNGQTETALAASITHSVHEPRDSAGSIPRQSGNESRV